MTDTLVMLQYGMTNPTDALIPDRLAELDGISLLRGKHSPDHQFCAMELLAYLAGEPHSDHPSCGSDVLGAFVRPLNDWMTDQERQQLKPFVPRMFGTRGTRDQEQKRGFMLADWAIHFCAPLALRARGHGDQAKKLENLAPIVDKQSARAAAAAADAAAAAAADAAAAARAADAAAADAYAVYVAAYAAARAKIIDSALDLLDRLIRVTETPARAGV